MADYYVAWDEADNPECSLGGVNSLEPIWYRVWRDCRGSGKDVSVTPPMPREEAYEQLRLIRLLDKPAQMELDIYGNR